MGEIWNRSVELLTKYIPGEPIDGVKQKYNLSRVIKMASNENPLGPSPMALAAMREALLDVNYYPEKEANILRDKIAGKYLLQRENIVVTNGAEYAITLMGNTFVNAGDEVLYCVPTFGLYRSSTLKQNGIPVEVPLTEEYKFDLEEIHRRVSDKTKLIYICNPNNPTGTIVASQDIDSFLCKLPSHVIVIFDEAYFDFIDDESYESALKYVKAGLNVVVIKTFSKLYGLAGARVGYAIAKEEIIGKIFMVREAFSANRIGVAGAAAALDDTDFVQKTLDLTRDGRHYLATQLESCGFKPICSQANFLLVDIRADIRSLYQGMLKRGVIFRPIADRFCRVSVGTPEENELFMRAFRDEMNIR